MLLHILCGFIFTNLSAAVFCPEDKIRWVLTECELSRDRWIVPVPKTRDACSNFTMPPPKLGLPCEFKCPSGSVLNASTQICTPCSPGTFYAKGDMTMESFSHLAPEFYVESYSIDSFDEDCENNWYAVNDKLGVVPFSHCISILSFNVSLEDRGYLTFKYSSPKRNLFWFEMESLECESDSGAYNPKYTEPDKYKKFKMEIKKGKYTFKWLATTFKEDDNNQFTFIKSISISGTSILGKCVPCPAGTFSNTSASSRCYDCPANFYSEDGAVACQPCASNQFSVQRASKCHVRQPCTHDEYTTFYAPCNNQDTTFAEYKWIQPQTCNETLPESVHLPQNGPAEKCHTCNLGMFKDHENICQFCPRGTFKPSNELVEECLPCPLGYRPDSGLFYSKWHAFPPYVNAICVDMLGNNCKRKYSWRPNKDYLITAPLQDSDKYQILFVSFENAKSNPFQASRIAFTFSVRCTGTCLFVFAAGIDDFSEIIRTWEFKQNMSHTFVTYDTDIRYSKPNITFHFIFSRSSSIYRHLDEARFYELNITNIDIGGAYRCVICPSGMDEDNRCFTCPRGFIMDSGKCVKCANNTIIARNDSQNMQQCAPCPNLAYSHDYKYCFLPCKFHFLNATFDLSNSSQAYFTGLKRTSDEGFTHALSFSLCGSDVLNCKEATEYGEDSRICVESYVNAQMKSAIQDSSSDVFKLSIGDQLVSVNISSNISYDLLESDSKDAPEIVLHYVTKTNFIRCPETSTYVHLRCNTFASNVSLSFLPDCSLGRCTHCEYRFILRSHDFCPLCTPDVFPVLKGECRFGKQETHILVPSYCDPSIYATRKVIPCSGLSYEVKIMLIVVALLFVILTSLSVYWWKRIKRIECKYHKLVHSVDHEETLPDNSCLDIEEPDRATLKKSVSRIKQSVLKDNKEELEALTLNTGDV